MAGQTLKSLSILLRNEIKTSVIKHKYSFFKKVPLNIEPLLPLVASYNNPDWKNYKYLINLHLFKFNQFNQLPNKNKFYYYDKYYIEKKEKNYFKLKLPYTTPSDLFDMYLIKWLPEAETLIHPHPDMGCILNVLEGELIETRLYNNYNNNNTNFKSNSIETQNINQNSEIIRLITNSTNYIDNTIGIHSIKNMREPSYSLHIYGRDLISYEHIENMLENKKRNFSIIKYFPLGFKS